MDTMIIDRESSPVWTKYSLKACLERSLHTERALLKLYSDKGHFKCFDMCRQIIIFLSQKYSVCEQSVNHALILSQIAVALNGPTGHKVFSASCPFNSFWICISVICFSVSVNFHETSHPRLRDMMLLLKIPYSGYAKMFYQRVQLKFLMQTEWSLYFPTAIDFYECLKLRMMKADPEMAETIMQFVKDRRVHCVLSFCSTEWEMLQFSLCTMAVSAVATVIRVKGGGYDPGDGVVETLAELLGPEMDAGEISRCSELMYQRVTACMPKPN